MRVIVVFALFANIFTAVFASGQACGANAVEIVPSVGTNSKPQFSLDGRLMIAASGNGAALWDVKSRRLIHQFVGLKSIAYAAAISADGSLVAAADTNAVKVWNVKTREIESSFELRKFESVNAILFSHDGRRLIYGAYLSDFKQPPITVRELSGGRIVSQFGSKLVRLGALGLVFQGVASMSISSDDKLLVAGDANGNVAAFDLNGRLIRSFVSSDSVRSDRRAIVSLSPDDRWIASINGDGLLKIWDVSDGQ
jgi:WD40 repeat protein